MNKFRKFSFISEKIWDEDGALVDTGFLFPAFGLGIVFVGPGDEPFEIGEGGFEHGFADARFFSPQEIEVTEKIGHEPDGNNDPCVKEWKIPGDQDIIIAKGEEGFEIVFPGKSATAFVVND
jgi:hypothetical protein